MLIFSVSDFTQDTKKVFDAALTDEVIIKNNDGNDYQLLPVKQVSKTPFDNIPRVKLGITTQEIVEIIRECRAGV
jgi:hypothetical protein